MFVNPGAKTSAMNSLRAATQDLFGAVLTGSVALVMFAAVGAASAAASTHNLGRAAGRPVIQGHNLSLLGGWGQPQAGYRPRTVITTDGEQDDENSFIRYLAYADDFDTVGIVYGDSQWHWAGDGKGDTFNGFGGATTSYRWNGLTWIQQLIGEYSQEYSDFKSHDSNYPSPQSLLNIVRVGNIDFPGEMSQDTPGSDLIKQLLLDNVPGPLYLQAWGGLNTITRALAAIQAEYQSTPQWSAIYAKVSQKAIIEASGLQDSPSNLYTSYLAVNWPNLRVLNGQGGYAAWAYQRVENNVPADQPYYSGAWMYKYIKSVGPLGKDEFTYGDGLWNGDTGYTQWDGTSEPEYTFVSEGDDVAYLGLIGNGLQPGPDPTAGGWGGRYTLSTGTTNYFVDVPGDIYTDGTVKSDYDWERWVPDAQNDFASRLLWGVESAQVDKTSEPIIQPDGPSVRGVYPGQNVEVSARVSSSTGQKLTSTWSQYRDVGTYPNAVTITPGGGADATVTVPIAAQAGQTIELILSAATNSDPSMTQYERVMLVVL